MTYPGLTAHIAVLTITLLFAGCATDRPAANSAVSTKNTQQDQADAGPVSTAATPAEFMQRITTDLARRTGGSSRDFVIARDEAVMFNDGSLGCPEPGNLYTQALVDGYRVVLKYRGQPYDYRISGRGFFKLCTGGKAPATSESAR